MGAPCGRRCGRRPPPESTAGVSAGGLAAESPDPCGPAGLRAGIMLWVCATVRLLFECGARHAWSPRSRRPIKISALPQRRRRPRL